MAPDGSIRIVGQDGRKVYTRAVGRLGEQGPVALTASERTIACEHSAIKPPGSRPKASPVATTMNRPATIRKTVTK